MISRINETDIRQRPIQRLPFTLVALALLIGFGIYGHTHVGPLDTELHHDAGYSTKLLLEGHLHRLLTSILFTAGGWKFYASLTMFAGAVGWVEWSQGTRRAMVTFFGIHLLTLLIVSLGISLPLSAMQTLRGDLLYSIRDVGPSAGYYGCLGFGIASWKKWRTPVLSAVGVVLLSRLAWSAFHLPEDGHLLAADLAHAIAFPAGIIWAALAARGCTDGLNSP
ncbi:hypothetical protein [Planctomycetes bacterium TBK1r]|uniref:Rhomboid family protein n=1 Tax=Stieleria magnilauensis TaxID=2527963 RepID=A0ABX5XV36_9BACT|nr:hypothetical protein TBK1r_48200 [Planctomycetes bacterium TBK1r]